MYGQTALGNAVTSPSASRMFRIEVQEMRQSEESDKLNYPIRKSGSVFFTVPYARMNEQVRRITRMGGKIVNIQPLTSEPQPAAAEPQPAEAAAQE